MRKKYIVGFPVLGNYYIPIYNFLNNIVDKELVEVLMPNKITDETIVKGAKVSPDFVCVPFKYNMGNYIEAIEKGANVLIQAGGGCRYGYYFELQEQILKDMGNDFIFISFLEEEGLNIKKLYNKLKILNPNLRFSEFCYQGGLAVSTVKIMDDFETYMRNNYNLQINGNEFDKIEEKMLNDILKINTLSKLVKFKNKYAKKLKQVDLRKISKEDIKIGIVGELFTSMEPFSSFFIEKELIDYKCIVKRYTTVTYLLLQKNFAKKKIMRQAKKYIDYHFGADGPETIAHTLELIDKNYDGVIHIKPFGCSPEINAMPILQKISREKNIPIMYLTFDEQTTSTGIKTRIEAFYDMLKMKKDQNYANIKEEKVYE